MIPIIDPHRKTKYLETLRHFFFNAFRLNLNSGITMKKTLLAAGAVVALSTTFAAGAAENDKPQYLSDWWHQSVNVVGSYHTRFWTADP